MHRCELDLEINKKARKAIARKARPARILAAALTLSFVGGVLALDAAGYHRFPHALRDFDRETDAMKTLEAKIEPALQSGILCEPGDGGRRAANAIVQFDRHDESLVSKTDIYYSDHFHHWMNGLNPVESGYAQIRVKQLVENRKINKGMVAVIGIGVVEAFHLLGDTQADPAFSGETKQLSDLAAGLSRSPKPAVQSPAR